MSMLNYTEIVENAALWSVVNKDNCANHMENFCLFPLKIGPHIK